MEAKKLKDRTDGSEASNPAPIKPGWVPIEAVLNSDRARRRSTKGGQVKGDPFNEDKVSPEVPSNTEAATGVPDDTVKPG